jgi:hypothetical protein
VKKEEYSIQKTGDSLAAGRRAGQFDRTGNFGMKFHTRIREEKNGVMD